MPYTCFLVIKQAYLTKKDLNKIFISPVKQLDNGEC